MAIFTRQWKMAIFDKKSAYGQRGEGRPLETL